MDQHKHVTLKRSDHRERIYALVDVERDRQEDLVDQGKFAATPADPLMLPDRRLAILVEEVGEVARAVLEGRRHATREELIQVAAVCVAWLETF